MPTKIALIAGATGAIGSALAKELCSDYDWTVYGLSRNKPTQAINGVRYLQVDLSDKDQCHQQLMELSDVTHVYYCCLLYTSPSPRDRTRSRMPSSA